DFLGPVGIAVVLGAATWFAAPLRPRVRELALDAAFCLGLVGIGYATRIRVGSFINVVMPAYLGVCLLCGLGLGALAPLRRPGGAARRAVRAAAAARTVRGARLQAVAPSAERQGPRRRRADRREPAPRAGRSVGAAAPVPGGDGGEAVARARAGIARRAAA